MVIRDPGFWIEDGVFSEEECDRVLDCLARDGVKRSRAGARNLLAISEIREIAVDGRLGRIIEKIVGAQLIPYKATLFEKTGKANWLVAFHQDTALPLESPPDSNGWGPISPKQGVVFAHAPTSALAQILALRIQLDASTSLNGPLRVIPNSHHKRLLVDEEFDAAMASGNEVECTTDRGGVIAMSPLILHASSKSVNDDPRRVLHIEYAPSLDIAQGARLAIS